MNSSSQGIATFDSIDSAPFVETELAHINLIGQGGVANEIAKVLTRITFNDLNYDPGNSGEVVSVC